MTVILLRRIFPKILQLIELYLINFSQNSNEIIRDENMFINIFSHKYENIWNEIKENKMIYELKNIKEKKEDIKNIITNYFNALKITIQRFSEFGYKYNNERNIWKILKEPIKIQNHKGKGKYSMKMTKRRVTMRYSRYISRRTDKIKFKTKNRKKLLRK